jgi:hypothetical protein
MEAMMAAGYYCEGAEESLREMRTRMEDVKRGVELIRHNAIMMEREAEEVVTDAFCDVMWDMTNGSIGAGNLGRLVAAVDKCKEEERPHETGSHAGG